jgi:hypothetical protein
MVGWAFPLTLSVLGVSSRRYHEHNMVDQDDIKTLWDSTISQYRDATGVNLSSKRTTHINSVDDVVRLAIENEDHFKKWRNDKGKIAKFRSIVKASLSPLNKFGGLAAQPTSAVGPSTLEVYQKQG